jgi:hypothetical protein
VVTLARQEHDSTDGRRSNNSKVTSNQHHAISTTSSRGTLNVSHGSGREGLKRPDSDPSPDVYAFYRAPPSGIFTASLLREPTRRPELDFGPGDDVAGIGLDPIDRTAIRCDHEIVVGAV